MTIKKDLELDNELGSFEDELRDSGIFGKIESVMQDFDADIEERFGDLSNVDDQALQSFLEDAAEARQIEALMSLVQQLISSYNQNIFKLVAGTRAHARDMHEKLVALENKYVALINKAKDAVSKSYSAYDKNKSIADEAKRVSEYAKQSVDEYGSKIERQQKEIDDRILVMRKQAEELQKLVKIVDDTKSVVATKAERVHYHPDIIEGHNTEYDHEEIALNSKARHAELHTLDSHLPCTIADLNELVGKEIVTSDDPRLFTKLPERMPPTAHALQHLPGGNDVIPTATEDRSGLMSPQQVSRLEKAFAGLSLERKGGGGGFGGGVSRLTDIGDVDRGQTDGQSIIWNEATSRWIAGEVSSVGGSTILEMRQNLFADDTGWFSGYPNRTDSTMSFDDGTLTFTIEPSSTEFSCFLNGEEFTFDSAQTVTITDTEGLWFIYFNASGVLTASQTPWSFNDTAIFTALIYWDATNKTALLLGEERHMANMPRDTHRYLHENFGSLWNSGLTPSVTLGDGSSDAHCELQSVSSGEFDDEDIHHEPDGQTTYQIWYRSGANGDWRTTSASAALVAITTSLPDWNEWTGATWQRTEAGTAKFILMHLFANNSYDTSQNIFLIMGQAVYDTSPEADAGAITEINSLMLGSLPTQEMVPLATFIIQCNSGYTNNYDARVVSTDTGDEYIDWRYNERTGTPASSSDHGNLTGLLDDDHSQYLLLAGRSGGQTLYGGTGSGENLNLYSTSDATLGTISLHGNVLIDPADPGGNTYLFTTCGGNCLTLQSQLAGALSHMRLMSADGDGTDNVLLSIHGVGTPADTTNRERLLIGYSKDDTDYHILVDYNGTGSSRDLHLGNLDYPFALKIATTGDVSTTQNFDIPTTTADVGQIKQNGSTIFHTYGTDNLFLGISSGNYTTSGTGRNTCLGYQSGSALTTGYDNFCSGYEAGLSLQDGHGNVFIGYHAGRLNVSGFNNFCLGSYAGRDLVGSSNVFIGSSAGQSCNKTGITNNTFIGLQAGQRITTGTNNTYIGAYAGRDTPAGQNTNLTTQNSILIGNDTQPAADGDDNEIVIGYVSRGKGSNTAQIGNTSQTHLYHSGGLVSQLTLADQIGHEIELADSQTAHYFEINTFAGSGGNAAYWGDNGSSNHELWTPILRLGHDSRRSASNALEIVKVDASSASFQISNTGTGNAQYSMTVANGGGDAYTKYQIDGVVAFHQGVDNTDALYKISGTTLGAGRDFFTISQFGTVTIDNTYADQKQLILKQNASQTENSFEINSSGGSDGDLLKIDANGCIDIPTTSSTVGQIKQNGSIVLHTFQHPTGGGAVPEGRNLFLGLNAGNLTTGSTATQTYESSYNIGIGYNALNSITTGFYNTALGSGSLTSCTTGSYNSGFGYDALQFLTTGLRNVAVGNNSLGQTNGGYNVALGCYSMLGATSGDNNVALGYNAGRFLADGSTTNTTPNTSIFIGANTKSLAVNNQNQIVIGADAIGKGTNTAQIGNTSQTYMYHAGGLVSQLTGATQVGHEIELYAAQSGNAFEINSSGGSDGDVFLIDAAGVITAGSGGTSTEWDTAYGWGDHSGLYVSLQTLTDNALVRANGTGGEVQDSYAVLDDSGNLTLGDSAAITVRQAINTESLTLSGNNTDGYGTALVLYGQSHSTNANDFILQSISGNAIIHWDASSGWLRFYAGTTPVSHLLMSGNSGSEVSAFVGSVTVDSIPLSRNLLKSFTVENPGASEDITWFYTDTAITITQLTSVLTGSSTPSVTWTIRHGSDRSATGTEVVTSGTTTTSVSTGTETTSFNDATIPANSWVWIETTAQSGTVLSLSVTAEYHEDV